MRPVLFSVPLPDWTLPLPFVLIVLALVGVGLIWWGWRVRGLDLLAFGVVAAIGGVSAAFLFRGSSLQLTRVPIYSYGVMLALGLLVGWWITQRLARQDGLHGRSVGACYFTAALGGLLGARLLYILTNLQEYGSLSALLDLRQGGLVFYGGVLGGLAGSIVYCRKRQLDWWRWADLAAPALAVGLALGRFGCYLYGCDFGRPLPPSAPALLAKLGTFPRWAADTVPGGVGAPAWLHQIQEEALPWSAVASMPVHPTQLYEAGVALALFAGALWMRSRKQHAGQVFMLVTLFYAWGRFFLEIWRADPERGAFGPMLPRDLSIGAGFLILAGVGLISLRQQSPRLRYLLGGLMTAMAALALMLPPGAAAELRWSTSQWLAVASAIGLAAVWARVGHSGLVGHGGS